MTEALLEHTVTCPWCWSGFGVLIDLSGGDQRYVEDCAICCHPVELVVLAHDADAPTVEAQRAQ